MTDTERLNALFEEWLVPDEKYYYEINKKNDNAPKYNPKAFVKDGIVDEESYKRQDKKILFVLKEAYLIEINNEDHDMRDWLKEEDMAHNGGILSVSPATWRRIMEWTYGIRHSGETIAAEFPYDIYKKINREYDIKRFITEFFSTIAVMNIKKSYGRSRSSNSKLINYAGGLEFKKLLKKEIEIISPDIIVCCGTWCMLDKVYEGKLCSALTNGDHCILPENGRTIVIKTCHPARCNKRTTFNAVVNAYRQALKGE